MKGHFIEHQKDKLKQARIEKQSECTRLIQQGHSEKEVAKVLDPKFRGKLVKKTHPRGDCVENPEITASTASASKRGRKAMVVGESRVIKLLNDEACSRITSFYQLAVKQHLDSPGDILEAIKAIPLHLGANQENTSVNHRFCTKGVDSWCRYQRAIAEGKVPPRHPSFLRLEAVGLVTRVFSKYN